MEREAPCRYERPRYHDDYQLFDRSVEIFISFEEKHAPNAFIRQEKTVQYYELVFDELNGDFKRNQ